MNPRLLGMGFVAVIAVSGGYAGWRWYSQSDPSEPATFATTPRSVFAAGNEIAAASPSPAAPAPATAPARAGAAPLHAKEAEFKRLTIAGATPAMLSQAFELARECRNEASALAGNVQTSVLSEHRCELAPGEPDTATMKRMLEARVQRADFGAWVDVMRERSGAFSDDPQRWRQLVAEAYSIGKARAEPSVMAAEYQSALDRGDALRAAGQATEAQAAYREAAVYAVASAVGTGLENGRDIDVSKDKSFAAVAPRLASAEREQVITEGKQLAQHWRRPS